ncbi:MAG: transposase [Acutalibacteraceae bacterium]|nr:transposase [Acutalibacteraceae bacterium]
MDLPKRKPTRLKNYNYSSGGAYFITICTHNKQKILCDIVGDGLCALPIIKLTPIGEVVKESIKYIADNYDNISVDKFVIMPNHLHLIITNQTGGHGDPPLRTYDIIGNFKSFTTHKYGKTLWQRSFHNHIIRGKNDYLKIWNYIDTNPQK